MLDVASTKVIFSHFVSFTGNTGSVIVAKSAQIYVLNYTVLEFVNNTAINGGAMALLGFSVLELFNGSQILFDSNHASERGGAVYAISHFQTDFIFPHDCFISYEAILHPDVWNTSLAFINNTAMYGYAIYADSLLPCAKHVYDNKYNISSALKWTPFRYTPDIKQYTIDTSPARIDLILPPAITPGEIFTHYQWMTLTSPFQLPIMYA